MGVGGRFWDLLKPYARFEGPDFLRNKRVAVDLSFWIVQHDADIRSRAPRARSPHLRTTFFRTVALFSMMGAFPVFVVDGEPSPLKAQARIERFLRGSGVDADAIAAPAEGGEVASVSKKRNQLFTRYVRECVELLELLGMPVLEASSEAEAFCAQLNSEGLVDACITADSDAFLFGANCVIKCFQTNSKEPFECYYMSDVEAGLGLKRKQMIAIGLLVGNDHDLGGVSGFGVDTAVRFVQLFTENEVLDRLSDINKGVFSLLHDHDKAIMDLDQLTSDDTLTTSRSSHCSCCGHPGSKRAHLKFPCEYCVQDGSQNCMEKTKGFRCKCPMCDREQKLKEQRKRETWQSKLYHKIAEEDNFPNQEIIDMYLCTNHRNRNECDSPGLRWNKPDVESLVDFLAYHQQWEPSYIRQRLLPMLSTIFLRDMGSNPDKIFLLDGRYEFHSILRVKIRYCHHYYLVKWKMVGRATNVGSLGFSGDQSENQENPSRKIRESSDIPDEPDVPYILIDDGCWYLLTEENMELVQAAFPEAVDSFLEEKRIKESKSKWRMVGIAEAGAADISETPKSSAVQLSITQFYRSTKSVIETKPSDQRESSSTNEGQSKRDRKTSQDLDEPLPKSVRRRLLFG